MLRCEMRGLEIRLHVLALLMAALAFALGDAMELISVLAALLTHETAHMLAARACGLRIYRIDIMPFGGVARIKDLNAARTGKAVAVALAGPAGNLLLAAFGGALGWLGVIDYLSAARILRINALLMLFNLLPALPLDGGRALLGVLSSLIGRNSAARLLTTAAHAIAAGLTAFAVYNYIAWGILNLTYVLVAIFLIAGSLTELSSLLSAGAEAAVSALVSEKTLPRSARLVAIEESTSYSAASAHLKPDDLTIFAVISDDDIRLVSEREIARRALEAR